MSQQRGLDQADLAAATAAGIIDAAQAERLLAFAAERAAALPAQSSPDEENVRLVSSFNDIFVTMAIALFMGAASFLLGGFAGVAMIAAGWGFSEIFVRQRRMALPAIVLACLNAAGAGFVALIMISMFIRQGWITYMFVAACVALAAYLHFRRYRVPIDIALAFSALGCAFVATVAASDAVLKGNLLIGSSARATVALLITGLAGLGLAMMFDRRDPNHQTLNTDIAFWLHMVSAPVIVHSVRTLLPLITGDKADIGSSSPAMWIVIALFTLLALVIDRRALIVSSLFYIIGGMVYIFSQFSGGRNSAALGTLMVGALLIALSIGWPHIRRVVVNALPLGRLRASIPPVT